MQHIYKTLDGKSFPDLGVTVTPDHTEQIFVVSIRTMRPVSEDTIKEMIQAKFEVIGCEETHRTSIVR